MSEDQFTKLFTYIENFRSEVHEEFDKTAKKDSLDQLIDTVDGFVKRLNGNEIKQAARDKQLERLLEWAKKVSEKTGIPLEGF